MKIQKIKILFLYSFLAVVISGMFVFASCTKLDEGDFLIPVELPEWKGQYILLEEYTGHRCPNCPEGAKVALDISRLFKDKAIIVAMHVTDGFAGPAFGYPADYRTPAATAYQEFFIPTPELPQGMVNRTEWDGKRVLGRGDWAANAMKVYKEEAVAELSLSASMDAITNKITINTGGRFLSDYKAGGDIHLVTWIVEDSIVSAQNVGGKKETDYVHRHVMRGAVNGIWGEKVSDADALKDQPITLALQADRKVEWNSSHLYVVSVLFDNESKKVIQAKETPVFVR